MKKKKSAKAFHDLFNTILTGKKEESRKAAREVRKLLYKIDWDKKSRRNIQKMIENAPKTHRNITEGWREENFVIAISVIYFLHDREVQPDFLFPWLFYLLRQQNGNVRNAARRMIEHELRTLTVHIRCPDYKQSKAKIKHSNFILLGLYASLNYLLGYSWDQKYEKYKTIGSLPTSPFKTVQMILCEFEDICGKKYVKQLKNLLR